MKKQTFLRLSLLIPYLLWACSAIVTWAISSSTNNLENQASIINAIAYVLIIYAYGIILWGIPYTLLAISLWVWSARKQTHLIVKTFALAPVYLAIPIMIEILILDYDSISNITQNWQGFLSGFGYSALALIGFSLAYGYLCIGIVYLIYRLSGKLNFIKSEQEEVIPQITS